jgi:hypothetical protein
MTGALLADLATGKTGSAETCFVIALVLFAVAVIAGFVPAAARFVLVAMAAGLAVFSLGWVLL